MKHWPIIREGKSILSGLLLTAVITNVPAQEPLELPEMTIQGQARDDFEVYSVDPGLIPQATSDATQLLRRVPGADVNFNGQLAPQAQYRGMFGPRVNVQLDGTNLDSGGPNWMDPPLHYIPPFLLDSLDVYRGIAPVSSGTGIGGAIEAVTKTSEFGASERFEFHGDGGFQGSSADNAYGVGGIFALSNNMHRFHFLGSREDGDDTAFGDGTIAGTEFERDTYGGGYGLSLGAHEFSADYQRTETDNSGTPALPLDIAFFETDRVRGNYKGAWNGIGVEASIYYTNIDHQMDNFSLRPAPNFFEPPVTMPIPFFTGDDRRFVDADSDDIGYEIKSVFPLLGGDLTVGADGHMAEHNATVRDPDVAPFFVTNFNDAEYNTYGFFSEWTREFHPGWGLELGVRYNRVETDASDVDAFPAQLADVGAGGTPAAAVQVLRDRFNTADLDQGDNNVDAVVKVNYQFRPDLLVEAGFARKERSPSYIERYLWIPLEINAGLGDGNNYIGDPNLDPETSYQFEFGVDWRRDRYYVSPRGYYRWVDDFIQGTPVDPAVATNTPVLGVSNSNGDSTPLQFANVDAKIWGFDIGFGVTLHEQWRVDGVGGFVRGRRRDIDDNLYRIAPPNLRLGLTHQRETWSATVETLMVDRQDKISRTVAGSTDPIRNTNNTDDTPGYVLLNILGQWEPATGLTLSAGVENILDKNYTDHLSGFNRTSGGDVPIGVRLPGPGRSGFARLTYEW